jgi:hypothetical protein
MKKILVTLLCFIGLSGCGYFVEQLNKAVMSRTYVSYFVPTEHRENNDFDKKFSWDCDSINSFLKNKNNLKMYLKSVGAFCPINDEMCYFIVIRKTKKEKNNFLPTYNISGVNLRNKEYFSLISNNNENDNYHELLVNIDKLKKNSIKIIKQENMHSCFAFSNSTNKNIFTNFIKERLNAGK